MIRKFLQWLYGERLSPERAAYRKVKRWHKDVRITVVTKGDETYIVVYHEPCRALSQLGRWALDDRLSFDWGDVAKGARDITRNFQSGANKE